MTEVPKTTSKLSVRLLTSAQDVLPFVAEVQVNADLNRHALGFLPPAAYEDAARRGHLFVATTKVGANWSYLGHLLFGGTFPHARIFQMNVREEWQNRGVARALLNRLVERCEDHQFLSISAKVADDLEANFFWEKADFRLVRTYSGRGVRNRLLNYRVRDLDSPTLFATGAKHRANRLQFANRLASRPPVFVVDLNVVWDVLRHRSRADNATEVIKAAFHQSLAVMIADEFVKELERTSRGPGVDPVLDFALALPVLKRPPEDQVENLVSAIASKIFPARTREARLTPQDRSDLIHLATAIHHQAYGFVTSEKAITTNSRFLFDNYSIRVFDVAEFARLAEVGAVQTHGVNASVSDQTIRLWDLVDGHPDQVEHFLAHNKADQELSDEFGRGSSALCDRRRVLITSDLDVVCLASWDSAAALKPVTKMRILADEEHPAAETVLGHLLREVCKSVSKAHPVQIEISAAGSSVLLKAALSHGFEPEQSGDRLTLKKLALGGIISDSNWESIRELISTKAGLLFPETLPAYSHLEQELPYSSPQGDVATISLAEFESLFSPTLLMLKGRGAVIVPIRGRYSEHLLGTSPQLSLLPKQEASLLSERLYFSSTRNQRLLTPGTPIVFYESAKDKGRGAVIAMARAVQSTIALKREIPDTLLREGVLDREEIGKIEDTEERVLVTRFDTVIEVPEVSYRWLTDNGYNSGANFVCPQRITDEQFIGLVRSR